MDEHNRHLNDEAIEYKAAVVEAVTERVGDAADVAFDCHWRYAGDSAMRLAQAIESHDVWWLEDPVLPENHAVRAEVTRSTETTIATGENVYRKHGTRQLIEEQAVDIIQPDMPKVGRMRETRKIADQADTYYIRSVITTSRHRSAPLQARTSPRPIRTSSRSNTTPATFRGGGTWSKRASFKRVTSPCRTNRDWV